MFGLSVVIFKYFYQDLTNQIAINTFWVFSWEEAFIKADVTVSYNSYTCDFFLLLTKVKI